MDVRLPNGKMIKGVPEGTPKDEIKRKAIAAGIAAEADFGMASRDAAPATEPQPQASQDESNDDSWLESIPQVVAAKQLYDAAGKVLEGYGALARGQNPLPAFGEAISKSPTTATAELGASMATGAAGQAAGGLAGIATAAAGGDGAGAVEGVSGAMTYQPRGESSQRAAEPLAMLGEAWEGLQGLTGGAAEKLALAAGAKPGSPAAATAYAAGSAVPDAVTMLAPVGRSRSARPAETAEEMTKSIESAAAKGLRRRKGVEPARRALAESVQPQGETMRAFEAVGIPAESVPPEVLSGNQAFREVAGTARSVPGSELSQRYRAFMEDLSRRADELSRAADADDIGTVNARVEEDLAANIEEARRIESDLYQRVDDAVAPATPVDVTGITKALRARVDEVGGDLGELSPTERKLVSRFMDRQQLTGGGPVTYIDKPKTWSAITGLRKELNAARGGKGGFGDAASYELEKYGNLVSSTQRSIADSLGIGDDYAAAMEATGVKKSAQEAAQKLLGKQLNKSFSAMFEGKVKGLAKGRVKEFQEAIDAIPATQRQQAVTSFVYDQIIDRRNMDPRANIAKYNAWYNQLQANPAAKTALYRNLPKQARQDIDALGKITAAVKRANEDKIATGRLQAAEEGFKLSESMVGKVANALSMAAGSMAGGAAGGPLGSAAGSAAGAAATAAKAPTKLNVAASDVLASPGFQRHVINVINRQSAERIAASERGLANSPAWKAYVDQLPAVERRAINRGGATAWLTSQGQAETQEPAPAR